MAVRNPNIQLRNIRLTKMGDYNFIISNLLHHIDYEFSTNRRSLFHNKDRWRPIFAWLIENRDIKVAFDADILNDSNNLVGFVIQHPTEKTVIDYIYVKEPYRGLGVGKAMLKAILPKGTRNITFNLWTKKWRYFDGLYDILLDQHSIVSEYYGGQHDKEGLSTYLITDREYGGVPEEGKDSYYTPKT